MHSATVTTLQLSADVDLLRDNVHAVTRALRILEAFEPHEQGVRLTDLSERLGMEKSTVLRTARTLARSGYLTQLADGRWRLGPSAGLIGVRYQTALDATNDIDSVLRRLATDTHETAAFFVQERNDRICIARVDRPSLKRDHIRIGEKLPLDRGASGHVLMAFSGAVGSFFDSVRNSGHYISIGERDRRMSSIAVPVFGVGHTLYGALCISGTAKRLGRAELAIHFATLQESSQNLSKALAEIAWSQPLRASNAWHPIP